MRYCLCEGWLRGSAFLSFAEGMALAKQIQYNGPKLKYCPWCGQELKESKDVYLGGLI